ncbi:hypothetical protein WMY93_008048 [Mugilogobius chulae]|uniref:VWFA domain-containing protein n=1 Tax=Mugilogobius chulae TaxID=88201 RepID=A0AAW0PNP8_9GOBI
MRVGFIVLSALLMPTVLLGFEVDRGTTLNHQEITKRAFLNVTVEVCRAIARSEGWTFTAPAEPYTVENVLQSCQAQDAIKTFYQNMKSIQNYNIRVDKSVLYNSPSHHFHNEMFNEGRDIIVAGLMAVKASNKKGNYEAATKQLGKITHTVHDFYSHSNWEELGMETPNVNLLKGNADVGKIAARTTATCQSCNGNNCNNNILTDIINGQVLTSGYFALSPSTFKPTGKCSHGGSLDGSSTVNPTGGINKDTPTSSHGNLHEKAANMATAATSQILDDVRKAAGDRVFLQMLELKLGSLCALSLTHRKHDRRHCGSAGARLYGHKECSSRAQPQPSLYILVTFKDPNFGPLIRTTDPDEFKAAIDSLSASGGGDLAEMSLSGLQMALTGAPAGSDIFLFTDASAKDNNLKNSLIALIEQKKSTVNIMMTGIPDSLADIELYEDVAHASGGQLIRVSKNELPLATDIVFDSSSSSSVTLLEATRNPGKSENFTFAVDDTTNNVIAYVTGGISSVSFVNPSSDSQTPTTAVTSSSTVGNFRRIRLIKDVGVWEMRVVSNYPYTVKIVGESPLTFIYDNLGPAQGPLGDWLLMRVVQKQVSAKGSLELTLIGSETATVTEVSLLNSDGTVKGAVTSLGNKEYLLSACKGTSSKAQATTFQRLSSGSIKTSYISVTADELSGLIEPGATVSIPFTVSSDKAGTYAVTATNDKGFTVVYPSRLELTEAESGTEVTLTIQVEDSEKTDMNYKVMSFTVLKKVTDFSSPICKLETHTSCPQNCNSSRWQVYVSISDGTDGAVDNIYLSQGDGTIASRIASGNARMVIYDASCCSSAVEIVAVDSVGNVATCAFTTRLASVTTTETTTTANSSNVQNEVAQTTMSMSPTIGPSSVLCLLLGLLGFYVTN